MKGGFRKSMTWLHTWSGLVLGWFLVLVFLCGTASYFRPEISQYMRPELSAAGEPETLKALDSAQDYLQREGMQAEHWFITLPTEREPQRLRVFWSDEDGRHFEQLGVDSAKTVQARETRGGDFFYRLHFDLYAIPALWARCIVGICAMFMLVAIITGVIAHRKIFKDFFTFRRGAHQKAWLDAHNVMAVFGLPFHLLMTYTGLVSLMFLYFPWGMVSEFGSDREAFFEEAQGYSDHIEAAGQSAPLARFSTMAETAMSHWQSETVGRVQVHDPGDANARVSIEVPDTRQVTYRAETLVFDGVSGELLSANPLPSLASHTYGFFYGLHLGRFADTGLRWLLFLAGIGGTGMVATGLILWSQKRYSRWQSGSGPTVMYRLIDALNRTVVLGLPVAMASFFIANRLLPIELTERQHWEERSFMLVWAAVLLLSLCYQGRQAWRHLALVATLGFASVPAVSALTTQRGMLSSIQQGEWLFVGMDAALLVIAIVFAALAWHLGRHKKATLRGDQP
ncbi:hypothetical protein GP5015_845 [gamma proteobacterium HTCC5015]|nr:hypothetical protein GP5015_845 [gamma proteobacterium HTCC5015]